MALSRVYRGATFCRPPFRSRSPFLVGHAAGGARWTPALVLTVAIVANLAAIAALRAGNARTAARRLAMASAPKSAVSGPYEGKLVRRAGITPGDQKVYFVKAGSKRWVTDLAWLEKNGFEWYEVTTIPAGDLAALPDGSPLP
jgi:hypothetical protein